jgi:hypothetical protein
MIVVLDAVNPQVSSFYLALHNRALCTSAVLTGGGNAGFSIKQRCRELRVEYESAVQGVLPYTSLLGKGG